MDGIDDYKIDRETAETCVRAKVIIKLESRLTRCLEEDYKLVQF